MQSSDSSVKMAVLSETGKATGVSIIFTLSSVLLFAFIIKIFSLDSEVIKPVNQFLKVISIFTGCYFTFTANKGFIKGALTGVFVVLLTFVIFAILTGTIELGASIILELIFGALIGGISGIITVNLKR